MQTSDSIKNIAEALIDFHKEVTPIKKEETNPFFKSKYADLTAVLEGIKDPLEKSGLSFTQFPDKNGLTTLLMHTSGEWIKARAEFVLAKQDPQGQGSAITYMRRYALGAVLGLITEEDDDGNASISNKTAPVSAPDPRMQGNVYQAVNLPNCTKCGSEQVISPRTNKPYCKAKCWLKPSQPAPEPQQDFPIEEIPF